MAEAMPFPGRIAAEFVFARPARTGFVRRHACGVVLVVGVAAGSAAEPRGAVRETPAARESPAAREPPAAREQARLCERENLESGAAACREALALGIGGARRAAIRQMLARHLVALERWDELAELLRESVRLEPSSSAAWQRLGLTLLYGLGETAEAVGALEEAVRLAPADARARLDLALALQAAGRGTEASRAADEALELDPDVLDARPAARAALDAARRGEPWP
jgi:tetratricopeptide (TPR) repeat protein